MAGDDYHHGTWRGAFPCRHPEYRTDNGPPSRPRASRCWGSVRTVPQLFLRFGWQIRASLSRRDSSIDTFGPDEPTANRRCRSSISNRTGIAPTRGAPPLFQRVSRLHQRTLVNRLRGNRDTWPCKNRLSAPVEDPRKSKAAHMEES